MFVGVCRLDPARGVGNSYKHSIKFALFVIYYHAVKVVGVAEVMALMSDYLLRVAGGSTAELSNY